MNEIVTRIHPGTERKAIAMRLLDPQFKYTPSSSTNIVTTWRRFGYRPTAAAERRARQQCLQTPVRQAGSAVVTRLEPNKRKLSAAST